uniref:Uncharacterized protein n=1 Tax=Trichogramma kaykai TaxID=54128 RepID=A0ABD2VYL4_9HYME
MSDRQLCKNKRRRRKKKTFNGLLMLRGSLLLPSNIKSGLCFINPLTARKNSPCRSKGYLSDEIGQKGLNSHLLDHQKAVQKNCKDRGYASEKSKNESENQSEALGHEIIVPEVHFEFFSLKPKDLLSVKAKLMLQAFT